MVLAEGKHGTPVQVMLGCFFVDQLLPLPWAGRSNRYRVEEASPEDLPQIAALLDRQNRNRNFAPPVSPADIEQTLVAAAPAPFRKMFVVREAGKVIATLTVEDTQGLRQNVLVALPVYLRATLAALLRLLALPVPGLRIPSWWASLSRLCTSGSSLVRRDRRPRCGSPAFCKRALRHSGRDSRFSLGLHRAMIRFAEWSAASPASPSSRARWQRV